MYLPFLEHAPAGDVRALLQSPTKLNMKHKVLVRFVRTKLGEHVFDGDQKLEKQMRRYVKGLREKESRATLGIGGRGTYGGLAATR